MRLTVATWPAPAPTVDAKLIGDGVHLVTMDQRCMAGIVIEAWPEDRVVVRAMPTAGMVEPLSSHPWDHSEMLAPGSWHRRAECPR